jgi:hypothetical protein
MGTVGGIHIHEHDPAPAASVLKQDPLQTVRRPDANAVPGAKPESGESARGPRDFIVQLGPGEPAILMPDNKRFPRGMLPGRFG